MYFKVLAGGILFLYLPMILVVYNSFGSISDPFVYYRELFVNNQIIINAALSTLYIASLAAIFSLVVMICISLLLRKESPLWPRMLYSYSSFPDITLALGILSFFSALNIKSGFFALLSTYVLLGVSWGVFMIITELNSSSEYYQTLENAAEDLGATKLTVALKIILPRIIQTALPFSIYTASIVLDDVIFASFLSGGSLTTLPIVILSRMRAGVDYPLNALSSLTLLATLLLSLAAHNIYKNTRSI